MVASLPSARAIALRARLARLILAVAEDQHRAPSGLTPEQIQPVDDDVVERGAAPGAHALDRLARTAWSRLRGASVKMLSLKPSTVT